MWLRQIYEHKTNGTPLPNPSLADYAAEPPACPACPAAAAVAWARAATLASFFALSLSHCEVSGCPIRRREEWECVELRRRLAYSATPRADSQVDEYDPKCNHVPVEWSRSGTPGAQQCAAHGSDTLNEDPPCAHSRTRDGHVGPSSRLTLTERHEWHSVPIKRGWRAYV